MIVAVPKEAATWDLLPEDKCKVFTSLIMAMLVEPFEDAAFALKVDELSQPVQTDSGVHLIYRVA